jgi:nitrogen regulatory protein PII
MLELAAATAWSVAVAVAPLLLLFLVFQVLFLGLPVKEVSRILVGTLVAGAGLFLFLLGVSIAFLPFGKLIGEAVATLPSSWMVASFGAVLGFVTAWGEPAVRVLANEVEEASGGAIRGSMVLLAICVGVAASVAAGMLRIIHGIPLLWFVLPGYGLALAALWLSDRDFVAIAFDSGGVATGPLANSSAGPGPRCVVGDRGPGSARAGAGTGGTDRACAGAFRDDAWRADPLEGAPQEIVKMSDETYSLIVTIVRKGWGSTVLEASVSAGARGGTVLLGRGAGVNEREKIFGVSIEPEKEILLTVVRADRADAILAEIERAAGLEEVGHGIAFVVPVDKLVGVAHFMRLLQNGNDAGE